MVETVYTRRMVYRVRAHNTATGSENQIHDDSVAGRYGFRGGLVPGVVVYGYMIVPLIELAPAWVERGSVQVRFHQPFYEGEEAVCKVEASGDGYQVTASGADGVPRAIARARVDGPRPALELERYPERPLPSPDHRPAASSESLAAGTVLGSIREAPDPDGAQGNLLGLANHILMRNVRLEPWIHVASEVVHYGAAHPGAEITVHGRVAECFERKGRDFVVLDVLLSAADRPLQKVRHTAIWRMQLLR